MKNRKKFVEIKENIESLTHTSSKENLSEDISLNFKNGGMKFEKEHQFIARNSYFDLCVDNTILQKSEFKGFFNLFGFLLLFYIITTPINNMLTNNNPFKMSLFYMISRYCSLSGLYFIYGLI